MKENELLVKLASLITIAAAVWFVLQQILTGRDCCANCKGGGWNLTGAPKRKTLCG